MHDKLEWILHAASAIIILPAVVGIAIAYAAERRRVGAWNFLPLIIDIPAVTCVSVGEDFECTGRSSVNSASEEKDIPVVARITIAERDKRAGRGAVDHKTAEVHMPGVNRIVVGQYAEPCGQNSAQFAAVEKYPVSGDHIRLRVPGRKRRMMVMLRRSDRRFWRMRWLMRRLV